MTDINYFLTWLDKYLNFEKTPVKNIFWLDTMNFLCEKFGHPEKSFKTIHIAGSKGKGSTAVFTGSILEKAGYNCGIYASPHITDFRERICTPSGFFSDEIYSLSAEQVMTTIDSISPEELPEGRRLTWFEVVTVFAFVCFKNAGCSWVVLETGLGGRLDSTNVVKPECSVITQIELEHTEFLGNTLEKIAYEKAGIIKEKTNTLIYSQKKNVEEVFLLTAKEKNAPVYFSAVEGKVISLSYKNYDCLKMNVELESKRFRRNIKAQLNLSGEFQAQNALMASLAAKLVLPDIDEAEIEKGLSSAVLPGRFETIKNPYGAQNIPVLILDGAHTVNSIKFTMETLNRVFPGMKKQLLFGCAADKDVEDIAGFFEEEFTAVTITKPGNVKSADLERMELAFSKKKINHVLTPDFTEAIRNAFKKASDSKELLVVTGSFYLVSEVKKTLGTRFETSQVIS